METTNGSVTKETATKAMVARLVEQALLDNPNVRLALEMYEPELATLAANVAAWKSKASERCGEAKEDALLEMYTAEFYYAHCFISNCAELLNVTASSYFLYKRELVGGLARLAELEAGIECVAPEAKSVEYDDDAPMDQEAELIASMFQEMIKEAVEELINLGYDLTLPTFSPDLLPMLGHITHSGFVFHGECDYIERVGRLWITQPLSIEPLTEHSFRIVN